MRIAICDDEQIYRDTLQKHLMPFVGKYAWINISEFTDGDELLEAMQNGKRFDLVFLDIKMKIKDGIETATEIRRFDQNIIIIFSTSFTKFVTEAFTLNAFQYIVKPVNKTVFTTEFTRAIKTYLAKRKKYQISDKNGITALDMKDIVYLESYARHIYVYTADNKKFETTGKLDDEEKKLVPFGFARAHQSFLINMDYINSLTEFEISCKNGMVVPISARKKTEFKSQFNEFLSAGWAV